MSARWEALCRRCGACCHEKRYTSHGLVLDYGSPCRHLDLDSPGQGTDLRRLAGARGLDYAALRAHNPQVRGWWLPPGRHRLRVPEGGGPPGESGG